MNLNNNNNNLDINNSKIEPTSNQQKIILYFLCIYFGFRILYQIFAKNYVKQYTNEQEVIYFIASSVLLLFFYFLKNPSFNFNNKFLYSLVVSVILTLLYCFTKSKVDNQNKNDKENIINKSSQIGSVVAIFFYVIITLYILIVSMIYGNKTNKLNILLGIVIIAVVYGALVLIRNREHTVVNFNLGIFTYLACYLYNQNLNFDNPFTKDLYILCFNILFFSTFAFFSFFGVDYFINYKKSSLDCTNKQKCKALLGIEQDVENDNSNKNNSNKNNNSNNKLIVRNIFISFTVIICVFVAVIAFLYFYISKKNNN